MERYIAVDSGKSATKVATYNPKADNDENEKSIIEFKFLTKVSAGNFADDALEQNTFIMQYNKQIYKVGRGATSEAETVTNKKTETHLLCTLYAIASICSENEIDEVHAAIGMPVKDYEDVDKRNDYKNFILPDGEITISYKQNSDAQIVTKTFKIVSKHVYPETMGALFLTNNVNTGTVAVIDIGHLNVNETVYNNIEVDHVYSLTDTLGGNNLVTGLAQELSSAFSLVDEKTVCRALMKSGDERHLQPTRPNPELEKRSKDIIDKYLLNHVKSIRKLCDLKRWPVDFMDFIFIGGTSRLLKNEIYSVFGDDVLIPENPEFANCIGFLRIMVAKVAKVAI